MPLRAQISAALCYATLGCYSCSPGIASSHLPSGRNSNLGRLAFPGLQKPLLASCSGTASSLLSYALWTPSRYLSPVGRADWGPGIPQHTIATRLLTGARRRRLFSHISALPTPAGSVSRALSKSLVNPPEPPFRSVSALNPIASHFFRFDPKMPLRLCQAFDSWHPGESCLLTLTKASLPDTRLFSPNFTTSVSSRSAKP
jgi:hypothetical protein